MQEAVPYRTYLPSTAGRSSGHPPPAGGSETEILKSVSSVKSMVEENAVIVFGRRGCCMCHVVRRLLQGLGVNPPVFEVDEGEEEGELAEELTRIIIMGGANKEEGNNDLQSGLQFPAVFVGGKLFGGLERVMATHITGELVPILKDAGALWL